MAGTIDFSTGDWVDTDSDDVPDAPAGSVYVNLSIGLYDAHSDPNGAGYSNIASTGSATTVIGTANGDDLTGGSDSDRLDGADGNDLLHSFNGNDVLNGGKGNDYLVGSLGTDGGHDVLNGGEGNDTIDGGFGGGVIAGGAGDDTISYYRDDGVSTAMIDAGEGDDTIALVDGADVGSVDGGSGTDVLEGNGDISHLAITGMEILFASQVTATRLQLLAFDHIGNPAGSSFPTTWNFTLVDGGALNLVHRLSPADALNLTASDFGNTLIGTSNSDYLHGGKAADTLKGKSGSDSLDGGNGNDILVGGGGQDHMLGGAGDDTYYVDGMDDVQDNRGFDRVFSSGSFEIYVSSLRTLTLTGRSASDGTGNERNNLIIGNAAANSLAGLDGADTLRGGAGDDTFYGGIGKDILTGGKGQDEFVFSGDGSLLSRNRDEITDFNHRNDSIGLEAAIMGRLYDNGMGTLKPAFFHAGTAAADDNDYVIYNKKNGHLYYDDNGAGHGDAHLLAILTNKPTLEANDFHVI